MTLYDLLGALPNDDAEGLRTAFRRAVKSAHPDIRPGDPDAAWKFRRIVRAHEILGDTEQRAAYDHLLDLAHLEETSANEQVAAARIHRLASGVIALAGALVITASGFLLFVHMSAAMVMPTDMMTATMQAPAPGSPAPTPATTGRSPSILKDKSAGMAGETVAPNIGIPKVILGIIPKTNPENIAAANADPMPALGDVGPSSAQGPSDRHGGYLISAIARLRHASRTQPNFSPAVIGRGDLLHRLRKFDRAFADIAPNQPKETPGRDKSASATSGIARFGRAAIARPVTPVPRRRPITPDPSWLESTALLR